MKLILRLKNRTDTEIADLFVNLLGLLVIVFILTIFIVASGLDY